jgi:protein-tyrosine kinase
MERIREALKRARQERNSGVMGFAASTLVEGKKGADSPIAYTRTRTIEASRDLLLDKRIISAFDHEVAVNSGYDDAFKILSTQVLHRLRENGWNALMVTSPGEDDGKTLIAINLAVSMALGVDHTVLLVDADLREPQIHEYFGLQLGSGLSDYLVSSAPIEEMLIHPGLGNLIILPAGNPILNSSEMLGSTKMAGLVRDLKSRYPSRIVVFDLPPLLSAADVLALSPYVDAALLVVEEGKTKRDDVVRAAEMLGSHKLIGTVLNKSSEFEVVVEESSGWIGRRLKRGSD